MQRKQKAEPRLEVPPRMTTVRGHPWTPNEGRPVHHETTRLKATQTNAELLHLTEEVMMTTPNLDLVRLRGRERCPRTWVVLPR